MKLISGAVVEGWKWGHERAPENVEWTHRVTHYSVEFSPDGRLWTVIKDEHGLPRVGTKIGTQRVHKWVLADLLPDNNIVRSQVSHTKMPSMGSMFYKVMMPF